MLQLPNNVSFEIIGNEVLVYAGDHGSVTRLSGELASAFRDVAENPGGDHRNSHAIQHLVDAGLIQKVSGSGMSRRSALKVVGAGAGAGALTLALPVAAVAASAAFSGLWDQSSTQTAFRVFVDFAIDVALVGSATVTVAGFTGPVPYNGSNPDNIVFLSNEVPSLSNSFSGTMTYGGTPYAVNFVSGAIFPE